MKYSFLILCLFLILFSCKKEIPQSPHLPESIMGKIKLQLKDSVSTADMLQLDFSHSFISNTDKSDFSIIRIPLLNKKIESDFLLLKVTPNFNINSGRFIHIETEGKSDLKTKSNYNGRILI